MGVRARSNASLNGWQSGRKVLEHLDELPDYTRDDGGPGARHDGLFGFFGALNFEHQKA